jgi:hypothetical protein
MVRIALDILIAVCGTSVRIAEFMASDTICDTWTESTVERDTGEKVRSLATAGRAQ